MKKRKTKQRKKMAGQCAERLASQEPAQTTRLTLKDQELEEENSDCAHVCWLAAQGDALLRALGKATSAKCQARISSPSLCPTPCVRHRYLAQPTQKLTVNRL